MEVDSNMATIDEDAAIGSMRSRPGSSTSNKDSKGLVEGPTDSCGAQKVDPRVKVATMTLTDTSTYHGEINGNGIPDGLGVLLSVFGATYSGAMKDGKKHGAGVELQTNGTTYSGEFRDGVANGYGIYIGVLGDKYIGQWEDGARHGVGVCVDAEAVMTIGYFNMDEPELEIDNLSWDENVEPHMLRAILAEKEAICNQEAARERHNDAVLQEMNAIGSETFRTTEEIEAFEAREESDLEAFIQNQCDEIQGVNAAATELKFEEAQFTQRQKELRAEITAQRQELSLLAKHCAMVETRQFQVREAERTLTTLQRQLDVLVPNTDVTQVRRATLPCQTETI